MKPFPYDLTGPIGSAATLGLIVLQSDETVEQDFRRLFASPDVALHFTRIPSGTDVTPETLAEMEQELPSAAGLLPPSARFGSVGYACTSGSTMIGPERVGELIKGACHTQATTNPLTAARAALRALGITRLGIVSPYVASVAEPVRRALAEAGVEAPETLSFGESTEARVARIAPASIRAAALDLGRRSGIDGVFLSCTNLRSLDVIDDIEAELGLPVLSSNQVLAWHMAAQAGLPLSGPGRLWQTPAA
ncbi:maleate cis-trans isomerase family protein [Ruegeria marina]|uniref:Maleate isomerase n=1 Tax=Ruegeria marina TaxID=639004 RepID=A0A1G6JJ12_9RHOB|nr:aspartate/glutamate racemase family protein [Ruegeria marina]SDC18657.1 maleate isomerase [Ruegeria marina]